MEDVKLCWMKTKNKTINVEEQGQSMPTFPRMRSAWRTHQLTGHPWLRFPTRAAAPRLVPGGRADGSLHSSVSCSSASVAGVSWAGCCWSTLLSSSLTRGHGSQWERTTTPAPLTVQLKQELKQRNYYQVFIIADISSLTSLFLLPSKR